jgi:hypothetical protein
VLVQKDNFTDVGDFHEKFGLYNVGAESSPLRDGVFHFPPGPRPAADITEELLKFRLKFLEEELIELAQSMHFARLAKPGGGDMIGVSVDHPHAFDALLDLVYVALGTAHLLGYPWQAGWEAVQAANMAKERCAINHVWSQNDDGTCCDQPRWKHGTRGSTFDVLKPPGWTPPDIAAVLRKHGFNV